MRSMRLRRLRDRGVAEMDGMKDTCTGRKVGRRAPSRRSSTVLMVAGTSKSGCEESHTMLAESRFVLALLPL